MPVTDRSRICKELGYAQLRDCIWRELLRDIERALSVPEERANCLKAVMEHPTVLAFAHELCGPTLATTGEEHAEVDYEKAPYTDWHRDYPWDALAGFCPLWRFGIYFRDYSLRSGGLQVVRGSHLWGVGPHIMRDEDRVLIESVPGDVVVWNLRTIHAAGADNRGLPHAVPRNAIFFDYGTPGPDLDRYVNWRKETEPARLAKQKAKADG